ncbi:uncharacterized protein LOC129776484 [Toxorhynchites rutilus septentrionalis]|uniref:uncharacterized protein LOC129776484 n=1 Tax=Toxorhynchites rutilus septentrionalis TaxID=329112 RepID=UPI0024798C74|nr:uncharacterized protein LOC129776484 [Toxorhynchites rutilus septentrionalis]
MLVRKSREGKMSEPIAVKTNLGWVVYGVQSTVDSMNTSHTYHICTCSESDDTKLHQIVKNYFSLDSAGIIKQERTLLSREDEQAVALLESRTRYNGERFETGLLWRSDGIRLPNNRSIADRRFKCLENRMDRDKELAKVLHEKMADYRTKDYIRKLSPEKLAENHERVWYLPIFPVSNPNKPGKIRIVWDAAAAVHGVSLNSALLTGPDQLSSLVGILYQFREHRIGICADIREMFHQVRILPEDQHCQRFLWRDDPEQCEPSIYVMQVMTFGACCSPSAAQFVKNRNAERFQNVHPEAVAIIKYKHYVDDMVLSTQTVEKAIELATTVRFIHEQGGFEIRNWVSNSPEVLAKINGITVTEKNLDLTSELASQKILGMWWDTQADTFKYKICWSRFDSDLLEGTRRPTKREILRTLMTIYDPLGLIEHFMVLLKILLQEVWRADVGWDESIPQAQFENWQVWLKLLPELEKLQISRCYQRNTTVDEETIVEMHTFVDSSETAMAATVYLRFVRNGDVECTLVGAKTRVAPIKYTSIPRLELQAAVIGCRLASSIKKNLNFKISKHVFWTDSRNVLCWLRSDHRRYSVFVASRVGEILESTDLQDWRWVPTGSNVADDGTRWKTRPDLTSESRWYMGPAFLKKCEAEWPVLPIKTVSTEEELRPRILVHCLAPASVIDVGRFSSWRTMIAVTAWVFRFFSNLRHRISGESTTSGPIASEELRRAEQYHFKQAQREVYQNEITVLKTCDSNGTYKHLQKSSPLYKLSPFVDEFGVLKMRGRTGTCTYLHADARNPTILPPNHPITSLLLRYYHERYLHRNHEIVVNEVRQKYRIFRLRPALAKIRKNCQWCKNRDVLPQPPEMADLPEARLAAYTRPFAHVGIDYFGPIEVSVGRRIEKRWGVLLTCLTTRGVYIEVASTLTTNSCIMAIKNFIVRRGTPVSFYSDCGTNFVGASKVLREALREVDRHQLMREFVTPTTSWHFNPPASPHMGGIWERLIRSVKRNLMEVLAVKHPTDEELRNALTEIEGILNSRPLTHVPIEDEAAAALTPNHFILGSSDGSKPLTLIDDDKANLRRGWPTSQWLANLFWKRWIKDYLPEISRRTKWYEKVKPLEVGDIVLIVDVDNPRNCWPKGKVIGVVSSGGQTRKATIQTSSGVYERPVVKLAVLDVRRGVE